MSTTTEHDAAQVERANASSATPLVFVHGRWPLPSSWDRWVTLFASARDDDAESLDAVAGCEFVDDRVRLVE